MQNNLKSKLSIVLGLLVIIIGLVYIFNLKNPHAPYQVLTPEGYPAGVKIALYKDTPPIFPSGIILENKVLKSSSVLTTADGKTQITVSYISDMKMPDLLSLYKDTLMKAGWRVSVQDLKHSNYLLTMLKGGETVLLSMSLTRELQPLLTFEYTK